MAPSNHERVGRALELLNAGLMPFFERELRAAYGDQWHEEARLALNDPRHSGARREGANRDTTAMLGVMIGRWQKVFARTLGQAERSLVGELRDTRNRWAHQQPFTLDELTQAVRQYLAWKSIEDEQETRNDFQYSYRASFYCLAVSVLCGALVSEGWRAFAACQMHCALFFPNGKTLRAGCDVHGRCWVIVIGN